MTKYTAYHHYRLLHKRGRHDLPPVLQIGQQPVAGGPLEWSDVPVVIELSAGGDVLPLAVFHDRCTYVCEVPDLSLMSPAELLREINRGIYAWWAATDWQRMPSRIVLPARLYSECAMTAVPYTNGEVTVLEFIKKNNIMANAGRWAVIVPGDDKTT